MGFALNWRHVEMIRDEPHRLGWLIGKNRLTPMHSMWIKHVWDSWGEHRALQAHRGAYKTTSVVEVGAMRWLMFFPSHRIAIIRKKFNDAAGVVDTIANAMAKPEVQALFEVAHGRKPKTLVNRRGELLYDFKQTSTPQLSVTALGLDSGYTGQHFDKVLLDDFCTLKDRLSRAEREKTKEHVREIVTNVLDPGQTAGFTGTPWHNDDAWSVVPVQPLKFPVSATGILSQDDIDAKKKTTTPFLWAANYDLELKTDEGALFQDPAYAKWERAAGVQAHLDAAFDGDHTCALTILAKKGSGYQGIGYVYPGNVKDWLGFIKSVCDRFRVQSLWMETNADKGYTADALRAIGVPITQRTQYSEGMNKHVKISTNLYEAWPLIEWDEDETDPEYLEQVLDYREGQEPDDAPDSAASLIQRAFKSGRMDGIWQM